jgi:uncharacterized membrane protein YqhA
MNPIERSIEAILWNSRFLVLLPVFVALLLAIGVFVVTTVDAVIILGDSVRYVDPQISADDRTVLRLDTISNVVAVVDGYLLAAILLIFALGMYELFVNKIDAAEGSEFAERLLLIRSLDDLKNRLANVILLILIVKYFQAALNLKYDTAADLLSLAIGVILIAGALFLSGRAKPEALNEKGEKSSDG